MNIRYVEAEKNHEKTDFCGSTLYRAQPAKNPKFAPKHYIEQAQGKFQDHTLEEQSAIMQDHCRQYKTDTVSLLLSLLSGRPAAGRRQWSAYC